MTTPSHEQTRICFPLMNAHDRHARRLVTGTCNISGRVGLDGAAALDDAVHGALTPRLAAVRAAAEGAGVEVARGARARRLRYLFDELQQAAHCPNNNV